MIIENINIIRDHYDTELENDYFTKYYFHLTNLCRKKK